MNRFAKIFFGFFLSILNFNVFAATPPAQTPPEDAKKLRAFLGHWQGNVEMKEAEKPSTQAKVTLFCKTISDSWGIQCDTRMLAPEMKYLETDLMGFDSVANKIHWFSVTNMAEVHDHAGTWLQNGDLKVEHLGKMNGEEMKEEILVKFSGKNSISAVTTTLVGGKLVSTATFSLKK